MDTGNHFLLDVLALVDELYQPDRADTHTGQPGQPYIYPDLKMFKVATIATLKQKRKPCEVSRFLRAHPSLCLCLWVCASHPPGTPGPGPRSRSGPPTGSAARALRTDVPPPLPEAGSGHQTPDPRLGPVPHRAEARHRRHYRGRRQTDDHRSGAPLASEGPGAEPLSHPGYATWTPTVNGPPVAIGVGCKGMASTSA